MTGVSRTSYSRALEVLNHECICLLPRTDLPLEALILETQLRRAPVLPITPKEAGNSILGNSKFATKITQPFLDEFPLLT